MGGSELRLGAPEWHIMNNTYEPESHTITMLYKVTQDAYVRVFGTRELNLSRRDVDKIKTCYRTLKTIIKELDLREQRDSSLTTSIPLL